MFRECWEEIGIEREWVDVWTTLPPLSTTHAGDSAAVPVIGFIRDYSPGLLKVSELEVEEVFCVRFSELADPAVHGYTQFRMEVQRKHGSLQCIVASMFHIRPLFHALLNEIFASYLFDTDNTDLFISVSVYMLCIFSLSFVPAGSVQGGPGYSLPIYNSTPHPVWGLTAIITFQLLRSILPSKIYKHKIQFQSGVRL